MDIVTEYDVLLAGMFIGFYISIIAVGTWAMAMYQYHCFRYLGGAPDVKCSADWSVIADIVTEHSW